MFHGVLDVWGRRGGVSWVLDVGGVFTVAAGAGVIISHYPQGRRLCSPVTSGFIELAALCCLLPAGKIQHFHSTKCTCLVASVISVALHYPFDSDGHF